MACSKEITSEERSKQAYQSTNDLLIGIVDTSPDETMFVNGIQKAVDEINLKGGVLGRHIQTMVDYDYNYENRSLRIAKKFAKHVDMCAAIGHFDPNIAMSVSIIYKKTGMLFFSPGADLLRYGGSYIFNTKMSDDLYAKKISEYISKKYHRIIIFNDRLSRNKNLADLFYSQAVDNNLTIVAQQSFMSDETNFRDILSNLKNESFDIAFFVSNEKTGAKLIQQMREMKIDVPVMGTEQLDNQNFWTYVGKQAEGVILPTHFDPKFPRKLTQDFVKNFNEKFGVEPDAFAAYGYDMINLLAYAMDSGNSTVPRVIDTTLKFMETFDGSLGQYFLKQNGNISPVHLFFKIYQKGNFLYPNRKVDKNDDRFELVDEITLKLAVDKNISTIDPGLANDNISTEISKQLFLRLVQYDSDYTPVPDFALSWQSNDDASSYTFKLRKNVVWTNQEPVTAHDLVGTLQRNIRPENKNPNVRHLFILKNAKKIHTAQVNDMSQLGVRAIDDLTIQFDLEHPASYFPSLTGLPIYSTLPIKTINTFGDQWTLNENLQTNGPYNLAHHD